MYPGLFFFGPPGGLAPGNAGHTHILTFLPLLRSPLSHVYGEGEDETKGDCARERRKEGGEAGAKKEESGRERGYQRTRTIPRPLMISFACYGIDPVAKWIRHWILLAGCRPLGDVVR